MPVLYHAIAIVCPDDRSSAKVAFFIWIIRLSVGDDSRAMIGTNVYNDPRWAKLRLDCFVRDRGLCRKCGKPVKTAGNKFDPWYYECDHVVPIEDDPTLAFDLSNLQTLHRRCHRAKTSVQQSKRMQRQDGW